MTALYLATAAEREWMLADHIVASPTSGWGMQHLFPRPGHRSICGEARWVDCNRWEQPGNRDVPPRVIGPGPQRIIWLCSLCQAEAVARSVRAETCPACRAPLTDPRRSPEGWAHCRRCRKGWLVTAASVFGRDWPEREEGAA